MSQFFKIIQKNTWENVIKLLPEADKEAERNLEDLVKKVFFLSKLKTSQSTQSSDVTDNTTPIEVLSWSSKKEKGHWFLFEKIKLILLLILNLCHFNWWTSFPSFSKNIILFSKHFKLYKSLT